MPGKTLSPPPSATAAGRAPLLALTLCAALSVWAAASTLFVTLAPAFAATALFGGIAVVVLLRFLRLRPRDAFGMANGITLIRAAMIAFVGGFAVEPPAAGNPAWWIAAATAGAAVALDGVDGWIARRTARSSAFGARFDMEIDALAALVLCLVLWRAELTGGWILLLGALRYLFVAAGRIFPWMERPLPPRPRRRAICAVQGVLLTLCLVPVLPDIAPVALGGAALAITAASFLADTLWLIRRRKAGPAA